MGNTKKKIVTTTTVVTEEIVVNERTDIICILDRSGSVSSIIDDMIGGFNTFIEDQKKVDGECYVTVALFDDMYELLYDNVELSKVKPITREEWTPRGMTALYDAIGKTVNTLEAKHLTSESKPDKVLVCIVTDGFENHSREFKLEDIKSIIKRKEADKWAFLYLAANQDAFGVGKSMGFSGGNTLSFSASAEGASFMNASFSDSAKYYRSVVNTANYSSTADNIVASSVNVEEKK